MADAMPAEAVFPPGGLALRVQAMRWLAPAIREITLARPDGLPLPPTEPGAHVALTLPGGLVRSYSLVGGWTIAVNRDPASRGGSAHLVEVLRVGDLLQVAAPRNSFPLVPGGPHVFVAGGIGITPILSMIRALAARGADWTLHYAFRAEAEAAYLPELRALGGRLHLHDDTRAGRPFDMGSVTAPPGAQLYACGPAPMLAAFEARFAQHPGALHLERFRAETAARGFEVVLKRRGLTLQVPAGRSILEVALEAGVRVAHSCREGVCGSCETRVIAGSPIHHDQVLSPREKASGRVMMICCGGCAGERLVLDL